MPVFYFVFLLVSAWSFQAGAQTNISTTKEAEPQAAKPQTQSQPAFWQVTSKQGGEVFLMGSMHFGKPEFYPLPNQIMQAFEQANTLAVEMDITQIGPEEMAEILKIGSLPKGHSLSGSLSKPMLKDLARRAEELGLNIQQLETFKPWFAAVQLVSLQLVQLNYDPSLGIDRFFLEHNQDKPIKELETLQEQLGVFNSVAEAVQNEFLRETLNQFDAGPQYLDLLSTAWLTGNAAELENLVLGSLADQEILAPLFEALFEKRNRSMAETIKSWLFQGDRVFVVVGAGHLVGDQGVVELLDEHFDVKRIKYVD